MKYRNYLSAYILTRRLNEYREVQQFEMVKDENEFDENYYRVDDKSEDGRGNF